MLVLVQLVQLKITNTKNFIPWFRVSFFYVFYRQSVTIYWQSVRLWYNRIKADVYIFYIFY